MLTSIEHHGVEFDVEYSYSEDPPYRGGPPPLDPPECDERFDVISYDLTDRDEWFEWHPGEEPTTERLKAFARDPKTRDALLDSARREDSRCCR